MKANVGDRLDPEFAAFIIRLYECQQEERRHLARELHDGLTQQLALLQINLDQARRDLNSESSKTGQGLARLASQASEIAESVRKISRRLHPSIVEDLGLEEALRSLAAEFEMRNDILIVLQDYEMPERMPSSIATLIYRFVQEALRGEVPDGCNGQLTMSLKTTTQGLRLQLTNNADNDPEAALEGFFPSERPTDFMQGVLALQADPQLGAVASLEFPLQGPLQEKDRL